MAEMTPRNPDYAQAVRDAFARQPFMHHLGAEIADIRPGMVEIHLPFRAEMGQNHGFFHGGVIGALCDVAGGFAGFSLLPAGASILTVEYKLNFVAPGHGERLVGRGRVIRAGGTLIVTEIEIFAVAEGIETLCAIGLQTLRAKTEGSRIAF